MDNNPFRTSQQQQQQQNPNQPYTGNNSGFNDMNQQGYTPNSGQSWSNNPALSSFDPIQNNSNNSIYQQQPQQQPYYYQPSPYNNQPVQTNPTFFQQQPSQFPTTNYLGQSLQNGYNNIPVNTTQGQLNSGYLPLSQQQQQLQSLPQFRHAPVDASSLLKSREVRRVDCPVCHKTIEGDDPAINHHVNEHLE